MWIGKIALILYVLSVAMLFAGAYMDYTFEEDLFTGSTYDSVDTLASTFEVDTDFSAEFIFGDFIAGVKVITGIVTREVLTDAMALIPGFNIYWLLLIRVLFTLATTFLVIYIFTGRSL